MTLASRTTEWLSQKRILFLLLILMVMVVYGRTLHNEFVYDDLETIVDNPFVHSLENPFSFFKDKDSTSPETHLKEEIYRPLKTLSCALDYCLFGNNPAGFHLTNLFLHMLVVLLLADLLVSLGYPLPVCFIASLFFAIHPALSQTVSYISARSDMIAAVFLLLCLKILLKKNPISIFYKIAGPAAFFAACLAKETAVIFPLFLLLWNCFARRQVKSILSYWAAAFIYLAVRHSVVGGFAQTQYHFDSFWITQATMIKVWLYYVLGFFWPLQLHIISVPGIEQGWMNFRVFSSILLVGCLGYILFRNNKQLGLSGSGLLWFFLFLLPVANLVPIKAMMAWRFVYISWMGLSLVLCHWLSKMTWTRSKCILFGLWLLALSCYSIHTAASFQSDETLWKPLIQKYPHLSKPYRVVGNYYLRENRIQEAQAFIEAGLKAVSNDDFLLWDLARIDLIKGDSLQALALLEKIKPDYRQEIGEAFLYDYVFALYQEKKFDEITDTISLAALSGVKTKVLLIQAHSAVLAEKKEKAVRLYQELLTRQYLTTSQRKDCAAILIMLGKENDIRNHGEC
jgi:protein O-mannosyl-transferase